MSSFYQKGAEKRRWQEMRLKGQDGSPIPRPISPKIQLEQEKRLRRAIANNNERRRMQSINVGFQSLKTVIPHQDGEKLSKAAILQQASDYILQLEHDKAHLLSENDDFKQMLHELGKNPQDCVHGSPPPKRKKRDTESSDEGIGLSCGDTDEHVQLDAEQHKEVKVLIPEQQNNQILIQEQQNTQVLIQEQQNTQVLIQEQQNTQEVLTQKWNEESAHVNITRHVQHPKLTPSPPPSTVVPYETTFFTHVHNGNNCLSVSRRNLDTIVEAIRHLEGDTMLLDCSGDKSVTQSCSSSHIPPSDESGTDSSYEQDNCNSDISRNLTALPGHNSVPAVLLGPSVIVAPLHGPPAEKILSGHLRHKASHHTQLLPKTNTDKQLSFFHPSAVSTSQLPHLLSQPVIFQHKS